MLTPYPQIIEYNEAVQNPGTAFRDPELRQGQVKVNALGLPVALSGGFALTYMMATPRRRLAVRCFHREIPRAQHKYAAIARAVSALKSPYFVGFDYLADGIAIRGGWYPVVKMDWVEGDPLGIWLDHNVGDRRALGRLRAEFVGLAAFLEKHGIAHGDIQNGNVIIAPKGLKLVHYDGVFVPGMPADFASETGHRHFQHPGRALAHFGPTIDRFSFIAVDLSLAALIEDPSLHRRFRQGGETILFRANDFADPERSEIFGILRQHGKLRQTVENFAAICRGDLAAVPSLGDFLAGRNIPHASAAATPSAAGAARPWAALPAGANRRLVTRLLSGNAAPRTAAPQRPVTTTASAGAAQSQRRPASSNQAILQALRPRPAAATATPARTPAAAAARRQPSRPAMPKAGSVVIHPRNRVPPPPQPAAPASEEPTPWQRVLRLFGVGT